LKHFDTAVTIHVLAKYFIKISLENGHSPNLSN
jgi:hypothetical protein